MNDIQNWNEITTGLYRYVIACNVAYEIHILYHECGTDISTAQASLFIVGKWRDKNGKNFFVRECLKSNVSVCDCIIEAVKDNEENNGSN